MKRIIPLFLLILTTAFFLSSSCTTRSKKHDPDFLGNYPIQSLGLLHLNLVKRYSTTLLPRDVSFVFESSTNSIKFHHKMMGDNIWISLKKKDRELLCNAINQYLAAFANKTLTPNGAKKKAAFGKTDVLMTWGLLGSAHRTYPALRFEYQFITSKRPYFILATATTQANDGANSPAIRIAVSPAQCKDLLNVINEPALLKLVEELKAEYEKFDNTAVDTSVMHTIETTAQENNEPRTQEELSFDEF